MMCLYQSGRCFGVTNFAPDCRGKPTGRRVSKAYEEQATEGSPRTISLAYSGAEDLERKAGKGGLKN